MLIGLKYWQYFHRVAGYNILIPAWLGVLIAGCAGEPVKPKEYELNYENCKAMAEDPNHPYRKEPIAIQGCEMILFEAQKDAP
jgi:hypothetical protein